MKLGEKIERRKEEGKEESKKRKTDGRSRDEVEVGFEFRGEGGAGTETDPGTNEQQIRFRKAENWVYAVRVLVQNHMLMLMLPISKVQ